jgi:hypothetical protein
MKFAEQIYSASNGMQKEKIKCQLRHFTCGDDIDEPGTQPTCQVGIAKGKYHGPGKGHLKMKCVQDPKQRLLRLFGRSNPILKDLLPPWQDSLQQ